MMDDDDVVCKRMKPQSGLICRFATKNDLPEKMPYQKETSIFQTPFLGATLLFNICDIMEVMGGLSI